ncbi:MAG: SDR family oxidoreductase [Rhodospirillaceae bacterium]|jgi:NAD(P)-dependent dehydrogenase (short-subunit alcohol dehydrogenase family)|nr:SDR family oxidoreductase [Rhodospirillaceae bacterium]MBT5297017.1 SDR family oxidoreductase [Rhodospirillaceae bacterium]MBT5516253.1 SDR family oxidoreductase [Rhodospirillaceae bacterium]MBT6085274.1 SDR family oxidoreductase [Rhodospirillaceae bacterium]MBT6609594.1 SDR family oxidoreductase [Rhodospirillaceae bacterium]
MDLGIKGKVALIVGGARGIGYAAGLEMATAGAKVVLADLNSEGAIASAAKIADETGAETLGLQANVTQLSSMQDMVDTLTDKLGPPDIVVVTAAIVDDKLFVESSPEDWRRMIDICLYGPMNILHVVLPGMIERQYGRIVCMATDSARIGQARLSYYAAAKGGVIALIKSVAQEVGQHGITINAVSPGATNTELRIEREDSLREQMGEEKYQRREQKVLRMYPLRRIGEPEDHASIIAFLVSDRASWITGQVLSVNGGFTMP